MTHPWKGLLQCVRCGFITTHLEAHRRMFNEGRCARCNSRLEPKR